MRWTKDQEKAITAPVSNLLVTAAAGAGKTQVLSGRILRRVQEGVDIDRILVITFTRAAAAEMKERIGRQLEEAAAKAGENQHLARQMTLLQNAQITTIHAFCKDVVSAYFYQIGIDPNFRMGDEAEVTLLKYEALDRVLEESYAGGDEGFLQFAKCFHGARSDDAICDMVLSLYDFLQSLADMDAWLCGAVKNYEENFSETYVAKALLSLAVQNIRDAKSVLHSALALAEQDSDFGPYVTMFQEDLAMTDMVLEKGESWDEFYAALSGASFGRRKILKNADEGTKQAADSLRDMAKDMYKTAASFIYCTADAAGEQMAAGRENVAALCRLVQNFHAYFTQSKRDKNILDFNDLEHLALSILAEKDETGQLVPSEAAKEVGMRYHEIYIDEYQDTNEIQEAIFTMVSGLFDDKPNIFMVGDMKQSIYRFRQTSPELFKEKKETYVPDGEKFNKVNLSLNFRSRKQVLYGINEIFKAVMSEACGEVCYNEDEMLHPGLTAYTKTPPAVEKTDICVIDLAGEPEGEEELTKTAAEARLVAQKINAFMADESFEVLDKETGEFRPLRYRDIAVLLRATRGKSEVFAKELAGAGIPVFCDGQTPYFENSEIEIMLSLLAIIDNPLQDIPLVSVMRSPIFGFTEPELLDVRLAFGEGYFYDGVARQEGEKFQNFVASLSRWRRLSQTMGVRDLLALLYRETNWVEFCAMQQNGAQKKANLNLLLQRASRFEATSFKGLFRFLGYVERAKSRGASDGGSAKLVGEDMDVVRIMSIHKSKGLEFPVVFLSNAGGQFNRMDLNGPLLCHKRRGWALPAWTFRGACATARPQRC